MKIYRTKNTERKKCTRKKHRKFENAENDYTET